MNIQIQWPMGKSEDDTIYRILHHENTSVESAEKFHIGLF